MNNLDNESTKINSELNFLQKGLYPHKLCIILNTNITGYSHVEYNSKMNIRNNTNTDYVFFNQLVELNVNVVNDKREYPNGIVSDNAYENGIPTTVYKNAIPDTIIQRFLNKNSFMKLLDALIKSGQKVLSLEDSCKNNTINQNIIVTLDTLFHYNNDFFLGEKKYKVVNHYWNIGEWNISTVELNKSMLDKTFNPQKILSESQKEYNKKMIEKNTKQLKTYIKYVGVNCLEGTKPTNVFSTITNYFTKQNAIQLGKVSEPNIASIFNNTTTEYDTYLDSAMKKIYEKNSKAIVDLIRQNNVDFIKTIISRGCSKTIDELDYNAFKYIGYLCSPLRIISQKSDNMYFNASNSIIGNILYPNNTLDFNITKNVNGLYNKLQDIGIQLKTLVTSNNKLIGYYMDKEVFDKIDNIQSRYSINSITKYSDYDPSYYEYMIKTARILDKIINIIKNINDKNYNELFNNTIEREIIRIENKMNDDYTNIGLFLKPPLNNQLSPQSINTAYIIPDKKNDNIGLSDERDNKKQLKLLYTQIVSLNDDIDKLKTNIDLISKNKTSTQISNSRQNMSYNSLRNISRKMISLREKFIDIKKEEIIDNTKNDSKTSNIQNMLFVYYCLMGQLYNLNTIVSDSGIPDEKKDIKPYITSKLSFIQLCKEVLFNSLKIMYLQREYINALIVLYREMCKVKNNEFNKILRSFDIKDSSQTENKIRIKIAILLFKSDISVYNAISNSTLYQSELDNIIGPQMNNYILQLEKLESQISRYNLKDESNKRGDYRLEMTIYTSFLYVILYSNINFQYKTWKLFAEQTTKVLCTFSKTVSNSIRIFSKLNNEYHSIYNVKPISNNIGYKNQIISRNIDTKSITKEEYEQKIRSASSACYDLIKVYSNLNSLSYQREYIACELLKYWKMSGCQLNNYVIIAIDNIFFNFKDSQIDYRSQLLLNTEQIVVLNDYNKVSIDKLILNLELSKYNNMNGEVDNELNKIITRYRDSLKMITPNLSKTMVNQICLNIVKSKCEEELHDNSVKNDNIRFMNQYNIFNIGSIISFNSPFVNQNISNHFQNIFTQQQEEVTPPDNTTKSDFTTKIKADPVNPGSLIGGSSIDDEDEQLVNIFYYDDTDKNDSWLNAIKNAIIFDTQLNLRQKTILKDSKSKYLTIKNVCDIKDKTIFEKLFKANNINVIEINYDDTNIIREKQDNFYYINYNDESSKINMSLNCNNTSLVNYNLSKNHLKQDGYEFLTNNQKTNFIIYPNIYIDYTQFDISELDNIIFIVKQNVYYYNIYFKILNNIDQRTSFIYNYRDEKLKINNIFKNIPFYSDNPKNNSNLINYIDDIVNNSSLIPNNLLGAFNNNIRILKTTKNTKDEAIQQLLSCIDNDFISEKDIDTTRKFNNYLDKLNIKIISIHEYEYVPYLEKKYNCYYTINDNTVELIQITNDNNISKNIKKINTYNISVPQIIFPESLIYDFNKLKNILFPYWFIDYSELDIQELNKIIFMHVKHISKDISEYSFIQINNSLIIDYKDNKYNAFINEHIFNIFPFYKTTYFNENKLDNLNETKQRNLTNYFNQFGTNKNLLFLTAFSYKDTYNYNNFLIQNCPLELELIKSSKSFLDTPSYTPSTISEERDELALRLEKLKSETIKQHPDINDKTQEYYDDSEEIKSMLERLQQLGGAEPDSTDLIINKLNKQNEEILKKKMINTSSSSLLSKSLITNLNDKDNNLCYVIHVSLDLHEGSENITKKELQVATCKTNHDKIVNAWRILTGQKEPIQTTNPKPSIVIK